MKEVEVRGAGQMITQERGVIGDGYQHKDRDQQRNAETPEPLAQVSDRSPPGQAFMDEQSRYQEHESHEKTVVEQHDEVEAEPARVIAIDTGHGQIDFKLRQDPRVRLLEKTNARYLTAEQLPEAADFIAMDVSFISATLVLPAVIAAAFPGPFTPSARR